MSFCNCIDLCYNAWILNTSENIAGDKYELKKLIINAH